MTHQTTAAADAWNPSMAGRVGDVSAMLRLMEPLNPGGVDEEASRRRLVAVLCRLVGAQVGAGGQPLAGPIFSVAAAPITESTPVPVAAALTPRQEQTLRLLLAGHSEKQVAHQLRLSPHTVHEYVKKLYRRFGVSTRAELLAHHLGPAAATPVSDGYPNQGT